MTRRYYTPAAERHADRMVTRDTCELWSTSEVWDFVADAYDMGSANRDGAQPDQAVDAPAAWTSDATPPTFDEDIDINPEENQ